MWTCKPERLINLRPNETKLHIFFLKGANPFLEDRTCRWLLWHLCFLSEIHLIRRSYKFCFFVLFLSFGACKMKCGHVRIFLLRSLNERPAERRDSDSCPGCSMLGLKIGGWEDISALFRHQTIHI